MIQKEVNELRRRLSPEKNAIGKIYGCYVNTTKQIIARIDESVALMPELECDKYMGILRSTLGGALGKNLLELSFSMTQMLESDECRLFKTLRETGLSDEAAREEFYQKVIESVNMEHENYVIIMAADSYDVPRKSKNDDDGGDSDTIYRYFICAICPVKDGKPELGYNAAQSHFHGYESEQIVCPPVIGFLYPGFTDRVANIHDSLYFAKKPGEVHPELIEGLFHVDVPMTSPEQRDKFELALAESLDDECSFSVMQELHEQVRERIELHKESKDPEPLEMTARDVSLILEKSGVKQEKIDAFRERFEDDFGKGVGINPSNLIEAKKFELETAEVKITVDPQSSYMIETRVIDGKKYILIPAGEGVEINGMNVKINEE